MSSPRNQTHPAAPRCGHCGHVIGVYEPLVVIGDGGEPRKTSRAAEPGFVAPVGGAFHLDCYQASEDSAA